MEEEKENKEKLNWAFTVHRNKTRERGGMRYLQQKKIYERRKA